MKHILIIASYGPSLINFRLPLIKKLLSKGYKVSVASPIDEFSNIFRKELKNLGVNINIFKLSRTGLNIFQDCKAVLKIYKIIKKTNPNIVISYTVKPIIYTGILIKYFPKINFYPLITGLGYVFTNSQNFKRRILKYLISSLYREGLKNAERIIFQNKDDKNLFYKLKIVKKKN